MNKSKQSEEGQLTDLKTCGVQRKGSLIKVDYGASEVASAAFELNLEGQVKW